MAMSAGEALGVAAAARLARLAGRDCRIEPGLTEAEFDRIEARFGFEFAEDHRAFLAAGLPVGVPVEDEPGVFRAPGDPWPNWRDGDPDVLRGRLDWPVEGVLFDVEHNVFWDRAWGERPAELGQALAIAERHLAEVPTLVPIYSHRYLPAGRGTFGHVVLSLYQTDIICYGADLDDYIEHEFDTSHEIAKNLRPTVEFWRDFV
ncbi:MAG TPA: hypothetical protein VFN97_14865 [Actinospica sp.]|nr:hypothetical protein [Actinospica sp.]